MRIMVYKGGLCEPIKKIGMIKEMESAKEADAFMKFFCQSIKTEAISNYRMFMVDRNTDKERVDHYVVMGDGLIIGVAAMKGFTEVNIPEVMREINEVYDKRMELMDRYKTPRHAR